MRVSPLFAQYTVPHNQLSTVLWIYLHPDRSINSTNKLGDAVEDLFAVTDAQKESKQVPVTFGRFTRKQQLVVGSCLCPKYRPWRHFYWQPNVPKEETVPLVEKRRTSHCEMQFEQRRSCLAYQRSSFIKQKLTELVMRKKNRLSKGKKRSSSRQRKIRTFSKWLNCTNALQRTKGQLKLALYLQSWVYLPRRNLVSLTLN